MPARAGANGAKRPSRGFGTRGLPRQLAGVPEVARWQPDVLGPGYEMMTLALGKDYEGDVTATLGTPAS